MAASEHDVHSEGRSVHANGTDIHSAEAGKGEPLLLLHAGLVSTNPIWADHPAAWQVEFDAYGVAEGESLHLSSTTEHSTPPGALCARRLSLWTIQAGICPLRLTCGRLGLF
jgi:hypothetical protein